MQWGVWKKCGDGRYWKDFEWGKDGALIEEGKEWMLCEGGEWEGIKWWEVVGKGLWMGCVEEW